MAAGQLAPVRAFHQSIPGYLPTELVELRSLAALLSAFSRERQENLEALEALGIDESRLDLRGTHPELGKVTLRQLLAAWVVHDLGHLAQVSRVMAKQYGDQVGPWREYMPVLSDRNG